MATFVTTQPSGIPAPRSVAQMALAIKITRQCISFLTFGIIIIIAGGLAFIPQVGQYLLGIRTYYHCFWAGFLIIVSCSIGIATYNNGVYRRKIGPAHVAFSVIGSLAAIGGIVISCINISNLVRVISSGHPVIIGSLVTNIVVTIFYSSYLGVAIFHFVAFARASRLDTTGTANQMLSMKQSVAVPQQSAYAPQPQAQPQVQQAQPQVQQAQPYTQQAQPYAQQAQPYIQQAQPYTQQAQPYTQQAQPYTQQYSQQPQTLPTYDQTSYPAHR
ncbi:uncharacterized protein TRIADDRAFT_57407 [Trichoplax adhaerens]|uniref:Uncharacterized protein n=1 Tax=Trichoplax adhaerens TaxID=10228 RepID=B3RZD0_TRIAD|nr:predicted protein [Trichoplax adhaerens]EDV24179.1 predicted protein [Trichoplax adhaerens]|eukprot:XP_002113705.1 predicted protein [Trichoplax adhaerens]